VIKITIKEKKKRSKRRRKKVAIGSAGFSLPSPYNNIYVK
jgi:hypothetical protein